MKDRIGSKMIIGWYTVVVGTKRCTTIQRLVLFLTTPISQYTPGMRPFYLFQVAPCFIFCSVKFPHISHWPFLPVNSNTTLFLFSVADSCDIDSQIHFPDFISLMQCFWFAYCKCCDGRKPPRAIALDI